MAPTDIPMAFVTTGWAEGSSFRTMPDSAAAVAAATTARTEISATSPESAPEDITAMPASAAIAPTMPRTCNSSSRCAPASSTVRSGTEAMIVPPNPAGTSCEPQ